MHVLFLTPWYPNRSDAMDGIFVRKHAQAVAAMAYGTESVPRVDKIFGPGNRYVTKAKQLVQRTVAIDMPAGPSEVLVVADETARPAYVAADMLSQAEHGPDSQAMLVCHSEGFAREVEAEVARNMYESSELEWLVNNAPVDYVNLLLHGDVQEYLKNVTEYHSLDN